MNNQAHSNALGHGLCDRLFARCWRAGALAATALSPAVLAIPALAQESDVATADDKTIIVTAQRRAEAVEDVPMTVTVLSQDTLNNAGVNSVRDLTNVTTGFQLGNAGTVPQPAIRGVTTINAGPYENNVALFVDGLYQTTSQVLNMDLPNVQNVQVLKGPQGTLYGRNATGGAILLDTLDPSNSWEGSAEASYGRFDDMRARGYISGPLSESIGISIAGTIRQTDGYFKRASLTTPGEFDGRFLGLSQEAVRAKVKFSVSETFRLTLGYNYLRANDPRGTVFTPIENVPNDYIAPGRNTRPRGLGEAAGDAFKSDLKQHEGYLRLELETGIGTLRSITGYTKAQGYVPFDFNGSYAADNYSEGGTRDRTWQEAVDLTVDSIENLDLILGGTYYKIKTDYPIPNTTWLAPAGAPPGTPLSSYLRFDETFFFRTKKAWALFGDATFHVSDRLSVNVGARYSEEKQNVSALKNQYSLTTGQISRVVFDRTQTARISKYSKFTPRASIRYEIADKTNIYASYSKGFRGGEWPLTIRGDNPANWIDAGQETVDAYEVGLKSARNRLRFEVAGFYYDYKNLQVAFTQNVNGVAGIVLQTAPSAEIYGAEASFDYEIVDNFNIRAGATWLHARYGDDFFFVTTSVNPAGVGFNPNKDPLKVFPNRANVVQDLSGRQMSRSPNFAAYIGFDYLIPNGDGGIRIAANAKYTDSYVVTNPAIWGGDLNANPFDNDPTNDVVDNNEALAGTPYASRTNEQRLRQGSFVMLNASVTWTDPSDTYYVRLWGNNLLDEKYRIQYNATGNGTYSPIGEPLTFGATVGFKFRE